MAQDEKNFKLADDEAKAESAKCKKLKDANANVGKAYDQLKKEMKEWSQKNPWLKQEDTEREDDADGTDPDPSVTVLGAGLDDDTIDTNVGEPYVGDMTAVPSWSKRSFLQLLQEDYGVDVPSLLHKR